MHDIRCRKSGISDPGFLLVKALWSGKNNRDGFRGYCRCFRALVKFRFPCDRFCLRFAVQERKDKTNHELSQEQRTVNFLRITLQAGKTLGTKLQGCIWARTKASHFPEELTKIHEENVR